MLPICYAFCMLYHVVDESLPLGFTLWETPAMFKFRQNYDFYVTFHHILATFVLRLLTV